MNVSKNSTRQYLVDIHKWRSVVALFACTVALICSTLALIFCIINYMVQGWKLSEFFRYFTTLSNILMVLASSFIIPFAINGIRKKRFVLPRWLSLFFYSGTICITMVFIFAMVFILPYDRDFAIGGRQFFLHVITPLAILISFELVESDFKVSRKEIILCMVPFMIYSLVYLIQVAIIGADKGGWDDMYMVNTYVPAYISLPIALLMVYAIAWVIQKVSNVLNRSRERKMLSSWKEDADPVEVNIEIYGLGRYYGLHGDKNNLSVPLDILESVSKHYSMDLEGLYSVYMKGLLNGIKEREE